MFFSKKNKASLESIEAQLQAFADGNIPFIEKVLVWIHRASIRIESQQNKQKEQLETIMASVAELEAAIQDVKSSVTSGIQAIDAAVVAAADRVIASINAGSDVSAQIAELEELKSSVSSQAASEVEKINAIDPAPVPPVEPPVEPAA